MGTDSSSAISASENGASGIFPSLSFFFLNRRLLLELVVEEGWELVSHASTVSEREWIFDKFIFKKQFGLGDPSAGSPQIQGKETGSKQNLIP